MSAPKKPTKPTPIEADTSEEETPTRRKIYDPNDLDEVLDLWEDRGYRTPDSGGWQGPDD